jgi:hypothetical protein
LQTYRRRPSVVRAVQWFPGVVVPGVLERAVSDPFITPDGRTWYAYGITTGRNGYDVVHPGDWVVQHDTDGSLAVCRHDVFVQSYEPADATPPGPVPPPGDGGDR